MADDIDEPLEGDAEPFDEARARAAIEKRNKENQSLRMRLKEWEPLVKKAQEADEAAKSEAQKAAEARAAAEQRAADAELRLLKRDIAEEAGLPKSWADRLRGTTKEEIEADAKQLAKDLGPKTPPPGGGARPVADLKPGALAAGDRTTGDAFDANAFIRAQARR